MHDFLEQWARDLKLDKICDESIKDNIPDFMDLLEHRKKTRISLENADVDIKLAIEYEKTKH